MAPFRSSTPMLLPALLLLLTGAAVRVQCVPIAWRPVGAPLTSTTVAPRVLLGSDSQGTLFAAWINAGSPRTITVQRWYGVEKAWKPVGGPLMSVETDFGASFGFAVHPTKLRNPWVVFGDPAHGGRLSARQWNDTKGAWVAVGQAAFSAEAPSASPQLTFSPGGEAWVAWRGAAPGFKPTLARYAAKLWNTATVPTSGLVAPAGFSADRVVAAATTGHVYCAFVDTSAVPKRAMLVRQALSHPQYVYDDKWAIVGIKPVPGLTNGVHFSTPDPEGLSLAINPVDQLPHVAFADGNKNRAITVMRANLTTGTWSVLGRAGFAGKNPDILPLLPRESLTSLAFTSTGRLHVAYLCEKDGFFSWSSICVRDLHQSAKPEDQWEWRLVGCPGLTTADTHALNLHVRGQQPLLAFTEGTISTVRTAVLAWQ